MITRPKGNNTPTGNKFGSFLIFSKTNTISYGTVNSSPTKTPSLSIQTKHIKPKMDMPSGSVSTKSNKVVYRKMKQERTDTETSD